MSFQVVHQKMTLSYITLCFYIVQLISWDKKHIYYTFWNKYTNQNPIYKNLANLHFCNNISIKEYYIFERLQFNSYECVLH